MATIFPFLNDDARVVAFGAELSTRRWLNPILRALWKLTFTSTPALDYEPLETE